MERLYRLEILLLLIASLIVVVYVRSLMPKGVGVTSDSVNYLTAMRSFLAGRGFLHWDGTPFTHWPPLLPAFLAPIGWLTSVLNLDFMKTIALTNAILFGLTFFLTGLFFLENFQSKLLAFIALISLVNFPLVYVLVYVWAEPLFNLMVLLFTLALVQMAKTQNRRWLILMGILAGLVSLQRYDGVFLVPTGALAILVFLRSATVKRRFSYALIFGVLTSLPTAALLLHNSLVTGQVSADFPPPQRALVDNLKYGAQTIVSWFTSLHFDHVSVSQTASAWIVAICALIVLALLIALRRSRSASVIALQAVCLVLVGYCGVLATLSLRYDFDPPTNRFLAPIYINVIFIVAFTLDYLSGWLQSHLRRISLRSVRVAVALFVALWVVGFPINRAVNELYDVLSPYCCMKPEWLASPVTQWLRSHPLTGAVLSNTPIPLYYTNTQATRVPTSLSAWQNPPVSANYHYLVWMNYDHYNASKYTLKDLSAIIKITPIVEFSDGGVYLIGT